MLNENRAWVMSILKNSESSKKIDCVINTVETAIRLIVHAIKILDLSVLKVTSGKAVSLISYFCSNVAVHLAQGISNNKLNAEIFSKFKNLVIGQAPAIRCNRLVKRLLPFSLRSDL